MVNNTDKEEKKAVKAAEKKARQDAKAAAKEEQKAKRTAVKKEKDAAKASRKGNMEEKNLSEDEIDYQQPDHEKTVKLVKLNSTQMWSPVKDIKDGIVITKDGRYVMILEFAPINFMLLPAKERNKIADTFGSLLNVFPRKFQIKILSRQANLESHVRDLVTCMEKETNERCKAMQKEAIQMIRNAASTGVSRRFLVSYQYEMPAGLRSPSWKEIRDSLYFTAQQIAAYLGAPPCNNALLSPIGDSDHALDILYECMCRSEAEIKPIDVKFADVTCRHVIENGWFTKENLEKEVMTIPVNDFIAPRKIDPSNLSYIEVDGKYYTFGYINGKSYPTECIAGWLTPLINLGEGVDLDFWVEQKDTGETQGQLTYAMQITNSNYAHANESAADLYDLAKKRDAEQYIRARLSNGQQLCYFSIMLTVVANDPETLKSKYRAVEKRLTQMMLDLRPLHGNHDLALRSSLPLCAPDKAVVRYAQRNIPSGDLGAAYPFTSYEINDPGGILIGRSRRNNSPLFLALYNRRLYSNGNMVIFGTTGAGKTFTLQCIASRLREFGVQVITIAPYKGNEYSRLCQSIGGAFITLAPGSPHNINVMEIRKYDTSNRDAITGMGVGATSGSILTAKIQQLHAFFSLLKPDMDHAEKQILDEALIQTYRAFGITPKNKSLVDPQNPSRYKPMPILGDLDRELQRHKGSEGLRKALSRFITGSAKSFNGPTNVNLDNHWITIDTSNTPTELVPVATFIAADYVYDTMQANPFQPKAIVLDELSKMIGISGTPETADFVLRLYKTVRSMNAIVISATQDLNDFFSLSDGWYGRGILANAKIKLVMKTEEAEVPTITKALMLSQAESDQLMFYDRGEGLLIANRNHTDIQVVASPLEHALITTDPEELERIYGQKIPE